MSIPDAPGKESRADRARRLLRHPVTRNAISLWGVQLAAYVAPLVTLPYLARVLLPEKFGLIAYAQSFIQYFVVIADYGFSVSASRRAAIHRNQPEELSRLFSAVMPAKALLMAGSFLAMLGAVAATPPLRAYWPVFVISFLTVAGAVAFPGWLFVGIEKMHFITIQNVATRLLGLGLLFVFVHRESDYLRAAAIQSGSGLIAALAALLSIGRHVPVRLAWPGWRQVKGALADGWPMFVSFAAVTAYTSTNVFLVGLFAAPASVGFFSSAYRMVHAAASLSTPIGSAMFPHMSRMAATSRARAYDLIAYLDRNRWRFLSPFLLLSAAIALTAPWVVPLLFGSKYAPTVPLLQIMAPMAAVMAGYQIYGTWYMLALGYQKEWTRIILHTGALNLAVLFTLIRLLPPAHAAAIACLASETHVLLRSYLFYRRTSRQTPPPD